MHSTLYLVEFFCVFSFMLQYQKGRCVEDVPSIVAIYDAGNETIDMNHMVIDGSQNTIYLSTVNHLYQLSTDLELEASVDTGPQLDSILCHPSGCGSSNVTKVLTNNFNKLLIVDQNSQVLLACGSVRQGACVKYKLGNISLQSDYIPRSIAANDNVSSTYAFIGFSNYNVWEKLNVLYVGTTFTRQGDYRHDVPAISSRNLYDLDFAENSFSKQSSIQIDVKYRDNFLIKYLYGFNTSTHAYFVTVQKKSHLPGQEEAGYVSRLARICINDANYDSYTEVTLQCVGPNDKNYNLLQDAKLIRAAENVAHSLKINADDFVLIGVFSPSFRHSNMPLRESALCIYSIRDIEAIFDENVHMCFNGSVKYRDLDYISGPVMDGHCFQTGEIGDVYNFCEEGLKISGIVPIKSTARIILPVIVSSLSAINVHQSIAVFLGTVNGTIEKVKMDTFQNARQYETIDLKTNSSVKKDMFFDATGQFLFVMSKTKVFKMKVENCKRYTDCSECLYSLDPYCGWCSLEKRCTIKQNCQNASLNSPRWLSPGQQCIEFENIYPNKAHILEATEVHLSINPLPELPLGSKYECVFKGATPITALVTSEGLICKLPLINQRPIIPPESDFVAVPLSVRSSETQKEFIYPLFGPVEGGTVLTIEGSNLGLKMENLKGKISVGDDPCEIIDYSISVRIKCRSGPVNVPTVARIVISNGVGTTVAPIPFEYKDVGLEDVYPNFGPESGGTILTLKGIHLNIGSSIKIFLDELPCHVQLAHSSSTRLLCITVKSSRPRKINLMILLIDNAKRIIPNPFEYHADPTIFDIKPLKSFESGGRIITVHGSNLNIILHPEMVVYLNNTFTVVNQTTCVVQSRSSMTCPSPAVSLKDIKMQTNQSYIPTHPSSHDILPVAALRIGFIMDGVIKVRDLVKYYKSVISTIIYTKDPVYFEFPNQLKFYNGDTLVIEGRNLNSASDESDVYVNVGTVPCNITSLTTTQLVCVLPELQPSPTDEDGVVTNSRLPLVTVQVGNLRFVVGSIRYEANSHELFPSDAVTGICAAIAFIILLFLAMLLVYRRKSRQAEREYKRIQIQMDSLENNIRQECKQAFTQMCTWDHKQNCQNGGISVSALSELHTDVMTLMSGNDSFKIPLLSRRLFIMKVFFPGVVEHPILNYPKLRDKMPKPNSDIVMLQLEQLINTKHFLLTLIDILERQESFTIREKINVASLLCIILMTKMEYLTDVLKTMLGKLILKFSKTKQPHIMLRRTESVAEKMLTNWIALCMYNFLKDYSALPLYLLFNAMKFHIEKGPIDHVTSKSRYSLSEEKLLKQKVDYSIVTIHLVSDEPQYEKIMYRSCQTLSSTSSLSDGKIICKVLDCDTVSQVKRKLLDQLYRTTPYSRRPTVDELDLEWRSGRGGRLILSDEDLTSQTIGGCRKLNTLAHYGIKDVAVMSLVPKQNDNYIPNGKIFRMNNFIHFSLDMLNNIAVTQFPINGCILGYFHLVPALNEYVSSSAKVPVTPKPIPEVYLTHLLSSKAVIQTYFDDFFASILTVNEHLPSTLKWLFDFFDESAQNCDIYDPEVTRSWKSNSLPLRFWINVIKNPDIILDIEKTPYVDSCLLVIAQSFLDSCINCAHHLSKNSSCNRLLFAKDISHYREMLEHFYLDIINLPSISDQELSASLQELSVSHVNEFDTVAALKEIYIYIDRYFDQIVKELDASNICRQHNFRQKLQNIARILRNQETLVY